MKLIRDAEFTQHCRFEYEIGQDFLDTLNREVESTLGFPVTMDMIRQVYVVEDDTNFCQELYTKVNGMFLYEYIIAAVDDAVFADADMKVLDTQADYWSDQIVEEEN